VGFTWCNGHLLGSGVPNGPQVERVEGVVDDDGIANGRNGRGESEERSDGGAHGGWNVGIEF
jgi:hypothetical protein